MESKTKSPVLLPKSLRKVSMDALALDNDVEEKVVPILP